MVCVDCGANKGIRVRDGVKLCTKCYEKRAGDRKSMSGYDGSESESEHQSQGADRREAVTQRAIVNELLAYCIYYQKSSTRDAIYRVVIDFFNPEEISNAKHDLWDSMRDHLDAFEARRDSKHGLVHEKELNDILDAIIVIDSIFNGSDNPVIFVAYNLKRLPRVAPEEVDIISLVTRLGELEDKFKVLGGKVSTNTGKVEVLMDAKFQPGYADAVRQNVQSRPNPGPTTPSTLPQRPPAARPSNANPNSGSSLQPSANASQSRGGAHPPPPPPSGEGGGGDTGTDGFQQQRDARRRQNRQRAPRKLVYGSKDSTASSLRAGKRYKELFIFNLETTTSADDVTNFLVENDITVCDIDIQSKDSAPNRSFRLKVDTSDAEKLLNPEFWPAQIGIRPYYPARKRTQQTAEENVTA